jgi:hypothetical protein
VHGPLAGALLDHQHDLLALFRRLPFFLAARLPLAAARAQAVVEVWQGESLVFQAAATFAQGEGERATLLGGVPPEDLAPGDYELRVVVEDGRLQATRSARITLEP